jgi:hypothetical protein
MYEFFLILGFAIIVFLLEESDRLRRRLDFLWEDHDRLKMYLARLECQSLPTSESVPITAPSIPS